MARRGSGGRGKVGGSTVLLRGYCLDEADAYFAAQTKRYLRRKEHGEASVAGKERAKKARITLPTLDLPEFKD